MRSSQFSTGPETLSRELLHPTGLVYLRAGDDEKRREIRAPSALETVDALLHFRKSTPAMGYGVLFFS